MSNLNSYKNKVLSIFGTELGTKLLALVDPCYVDTIDCDIYKACETLTSITYDDTTTGLFNISYIDEAGNTTVLPVPVNPLVSSFTYTPTTVGTDNLTITFSDGTTQSTEIPVFLFLPTDGVANTVSYNSTSGVFTVNVSISSDTGNLLTLGSDGGLFVDSIFNCFTVQAGASILLTDNSRGSNLLCEDDKLHLYSSDGSIIIDVDPGVDATIVNLKASSGDTNFAVADLSATANRTHDFATFNYDLTTTGTVTHTASRFAIAATPNYSIRTLAAPTAVGASFTLSVGDHYVIVDSATGPVTVRLPSGASPGDVYKIKAVDSTDTSLTDPVNEPSINYTLNYPVTVSPNGATVDGFSPNFTFKSINDAYEFVFDGVTWWLF